MSILVIVINKKFQQDKDGGGTKLIDYYLTTIQRHNSYNNNLILWQPKVFVMTWGLNNLMIWGWFDGTIT